MDEFWLLSQELRGAREQAHTTLLRLAGPAAPTDSERKVEVFVNLARRLQSLVHREISLLDELEDTVEDPDLLKELFHVDHLATRIRRHAENLAVLGGASSRRQWTRPIDLSEVLRSSVAEVEQYTRVKVVPPAGGSVRGHAVADVVHLLAELVENATVFSAPDTDVVLRAERVTAGIAVEVEDRGLGMPAEEQHRMNALLGDPDQISVRHLLADGRIGLFVVSALARRHGIAVELKSNIYGGVLAVLVLPQELLGAEAPTAADAAGARGPPPGGPGSGRRGRRWSRYGCRPCRRPRRSPGGRSRARGPGPRTSPSRTPHPHPLVVPIPLVAPNPLVLPNPQRRRRPRPRPSPQPRPCPRPARAPGRNPARRPRRNPCRTRFPGPARSPGRSPVPRPCPRPGPGPRTGPGRWPGRRPWPIPGSGPRRVRRTGRWPGRRRPRRPNRSPRPIPLPPRVTGRGCPGAAPRSTSRPSCARLPPRRAADPEQPVHDPGLMAAFQRGFGLAQSENQV